MNLKEEVMTLQRIAIEEALKRTGGNAAQAARLLGEVGRGGGGGLVVGRGGGEGFRKPHARRPDASTASTRV